MDEVRISGNSPKKNNYSVVRKNIWINLAVTLVVMAIMVSGKVDPVVVFMIGTVLALMINYPDSNAQRKRIDSHAKAALLMAGILLAAGAFEGIMKDSGMLAAMAQTAVAHTPFRHRTAHSLHAGDDLDAA